MEDAGTAGDLRTIDPVKGTPPFQSPGGGGGSGVVSRSLGWGRRSEQVRLFLATQLDDFLELVEDSGGYTGKGAPTQSLQ